MINAREIYTLHGLQSISNTFFSFDNVIYIKIPVKWFTDSVLFFYFAFLFVAVSTILTGSKFPILEGFPTKKCSVHDKIWKEKSILKYVHVINNGKGNTHVSEWI